MNPDVLSGIAGVLGVMIPVLALSIGGLVVLSRSRIGEAMARRIAGDSHHPECESQIAALQDQVDGLQSQVNDAQERLDFAERLLARAEEGRRGITNGDV
jgi:hypothetical protein